MAKAYALPKALRDFLEHLCGEYDEMITITEKEKRRYTTQRVYQCMESIEAINVVLDSCEDKMREFAERALLRPEGTVEEVAVAMGIPKGRGRRWKSQLLYGVACARGYVREAFDSYMVEEYPSYNRLYNIWTGMIQRCYNLDNPSFCGYGGRGIKVCDEWLFSYFAFERWARGNGYKDNLTIDRIDNDGEYSPDNCRWATRKQQQNNRRNNVIITVNGDEMTVAEAADKYGVSRHNAYQRVRAGWTGDEMVAGKRKE